MDKKIVRAAIWAFVKDNQLNQALSALQYLDSMKDRDSLLASISNSYLEEISHADRFSSFNSMTEATWNDLLRCFKSAYIVSEKIDDIERRWIMNKKIIKKGLEYIKKMNAPVDKLANFLYDLVLLSPEEDSDVFIRKMMNVYLGVQNLEGTKIFGLSQLMSAEPALLEAERLLEIFIRWGDYDAIKAIGDTYGKLGTVAANRWKEIIINCLERKGRDEAIKALSIISNNSERWDYAELLGADLKSNEQEKN
ncbi:MAG: hypothetical protein WC719_00430 [Patescibacteria group bacterium]|jgi:hypothetical protein